MTGKIRVSCGRGRRAPTERLGRRGADVALVAVAATAIALVAVAATAIALVAVPATAIALVAVAATAIAFVAVAAIVVAAIVTVLLLRMRRGYCCCGLNVHRD